MSLLSLDTYEHLIEENVVVSYKVFKLCGIPLWSKRLETSNYNYVGQFDAQNFVSTKDTDNKLYTKTNIGFKDDKEKQQTEIQSEGTTGEN